MTLSSVPVWPTSLCYWPFLVSWWLITWGVKWLVFPLGPSRALVTLHYWLTCCYCWSTDTSPFLASALKRVVIMVPLSSRGLTRLHRLPSYHLYQLLGRNLISSSTKVRSTTPTTSHVKLELLKSFNSWIHWILQSRFSCVFVFVNAKWLLQTQNCQVSCKWITWSELKPISKLMVK